MDLALVLGILFVSFFWDALPFDQDDAGSGMDAGNSFESALPIAVGTVRGSLIGAFDSTDFYKVHLGEGFVVEVHSQAASTQYCASVSLFMPDRGLWHRDGCHETNGNPNLASHVWELVVPFQGFWYVALNFTASPGPSAPQPSIRVDYALSVQMIGRYENGSGLHVNDASWISIALPPAVGPFTAQVHVVSNDGGRIPMTRLLVLAGENTFLNGELGRPLTPMAGYAGAQISKQRIGVRADIPPSGLELGVDYFWQGYNRESVLLTFLSESNVTGWISVGYNGYFDESHVRAGPAIEQFRLGDFPSEMQLMTPLGGVTRVASLGRSIGCTFVGAFSVSPTLVQPEVLPDVSIGGFRDPTGRYYRLSSEEHPLPYHVMALPASGHWTFIVEEDMGAHGESIILQGVHLPPEFVSRFGWQCLV